MVKSISIIHKDDRGEELSSFNHVLDMLSTLSIRNLEIQDESTNADALFMLHRFTNFKRGVELMDERKDKSVFLFPLEFTDDKEMRKTFTHKSIAKVIVASEYHHKYFIKTLGLPPSFVRFIPLPVQDYRPTLQSKNMLNKRVVLTPASVRPNRNFLTLIEAISKLKTRYSNLHYILLLSKHPSLSDVQYKDLTQKMIDVIHDSFESHEISFITQPKLEYIDYLSLANVILLPHDDVNKMYLNALYDGIVAQKPVIIPETNQTKDLIKRDIGALLYQNDNIQSIIDSCGLLLNNQDVSGILMKQNALISQNYLYENISPHYINLFRRFKEA